MEGRNYIVTTNYSGKDTYSLVNTYKFDGKKNTLGQNSITFNSWRATHNGACPKLFGYTANTKWYTANSNKYIFSENDEDFNIDILKMFEAGIMHTLTNVVKKSLST